MLAIMALVVVSCQKEDDQNFHTDTQVKSGFRISMVDRNHIMKNERLSSGLGKMGKGTGTSSSQKDVHDSEHGFTINTDRVKYIEDGSSYHSYTFPILRDVDNGLLENLVFSLQEDGSYDTFIVTYDLSLDQQDDLLEGLHINLEGKITKTPVDDMGLPTDLMGKVQADCVLIVTEYCSCGQHPNSDGTYAGCSDSCYSTSSAEHCTGGAISNNDPDGNPPNTDTDTSGGHQEGGVEGTGGATSPTCTRNCAPPAEEFVVDILFDESFVNDFPCHADAITEVLGLCTPLNQSFLSAFETPNNVDLIYIADDFSTNPTFYGVPAGSDASLTLGTTRAPLGCVNCPPSEIFVNQQNFGTMSELLLASIIIHENLHTLLYHLINTDQITTETPITSYAQLANAYCTHMVQNTDPTLAGDALSQASHQIMVNLIEEMTDTLMAYANQRNINISRDYAKTIMYGGTLTALHSFNVSTGTDDEALDLAHKIGAVINAERLQQVYTVTDSNNITTVYEQQGFPLGFSNPCD